MNQQKNAPERLMTNLRIFAPIEQYTVDSRLEFMRFCERCKLGPRANEDCKQVVMPIGNLDSEILVILENPGFVENETGFTLSGPSYPPLVGAMVKNHGFDELKDMLRTNINLCIPKAKTKPTKLQMRQCRHNLDYIVDNMPNLKLIIPVGRIALQAIEGDDAVLSLRVGLPGKREYIYANGLSSKRSFYTLPLIHPAHDLRIQNDRGRIKAAQEYDSHLRFIRDFYDNIDNIENYIAPYKYHICLTIEENLYWANFITTNKDIQHIVIDFETSEIVAPGYGIIICMAVAFELDGEIHAVVFVFKQCVEAENGREVKRKKSKKVFEHKWELVPWFPERPTLEQEVAEMFRSKMQGDDKSFFLSAWNAGFDSITSLMNWGFRITPRREQLPDVWTPVATGVPPRDIMLGYRFLNSDLRSLSLKTVLSASMPLISESKDLIESAIEYLYNKSIVNETGYMLMAVKPPEDFSNEEFQHYGKIYNDWIAECEKVKEENKRLADKAKKKNKQSEYEESLGIKPKKVTVPKIKLPSCPLSGRELQYVKQNWCPNLSDTRAKVLFERAAFDSAIELDLWKRAQNMFLNEEVISIGSPLRDEIWI